MRKFLSAMNVAVRSAMAHFHMNANFGDGCGHCAMFTTGVVRRFFNLVAYRTISKSEYAIYLSLQ